jgi:hypothetical protein
VWGGGVGIGVASVGDGWSVELVDMEDFVGAINAMDWKERASVLNLCLTLKLMIRLITNYETVYLSNG